MHRPSSLSHLDRWHIDTYTVEDELLGKGMFGTVRRGEWYGTAVAVKNLYKFDLEENASLFEREIRLMKELHHPHIVQFLGFSHGEHTGGQLAIVMEYLCNGSLEDYIREKKCQPNVKLRWCSEMAQALAYLHNRKPDFLIHRDVKPSNFMLSAALVCKLGDFGISRLFSRDPNAPDPSAPHNQNTPNPLSGGGAAASESAAAAAEPPPSPRLAGMSGLLHAVDSIGCLLGLTEPPPPVCDLEQTGNVGTARYMAPEVRTDYEALAAQAGGGGTEGRAKQSSRYSVQVDVFSLGMVYYFVFEGVPPSLAGATTPMAHLAALYEGKRPVYSKSPPQVRRIIDLCLRLKPLERPNSRELVVLLAGTVLPRVFFKVGPAVSQKKIDTAQKLEEKIQKRVETDAGSLPSASTTTPRDRTPSLGSVKEKDESFVKKDDEESDNEEDDDEEGITF